MSWLLGHIKAALVLAGVVAIGVAAALIRKSGADAQRALQVRQDVEAAKAIEQERTEARSATNADLDKRIDKWTRKP